MVLPWLVAIGAEYLVFRRFFARDLAAAAPSPVSGDKPELPVFALATVACTLAGFVLTSAIGIDPRGPRSRAPSSSPGGRCYGGRRPR